MKKKVNSNHLEKMTTFPLYDTLYHKIENNKQNLNDEQIAFFIDNFSLFGDYEYELVFALIRKYQSQNCQQLNELPWGIKNIKKGLKVDMEKLPSQLQQLLLLFMNIHLESLQKK